MPIFSHIRWVRKHFLTDPVVQGLEPDVRIKGRCLIVNSLRFKTGLSLVFTKDSLQVCRHENGALVDFVEWLDMAPVHVGKHQFECTFCVTVKNHERFSSVRQMYLDHCIQPMLAHFRSGKYLRPLVEDSLTTSFSCADQLLTGVKNDGHALEVRSTSSLHSD